MKANFERFWNLEGDATAAPSFFWIQPLVDDEQAKNRIHSARIFLTRSSLQSLLVLWYPCHWL
ncbi:MAG: hypothetical protein N3B10_14700 [Armatimonadetes bacterium]|nr:hypothetical protein [Armatimonadota bacterium]MCX7969720.1 hypothetical protein [Armatimonadota bacterium]